VQVKAVDEIAEGLHFLAFFKVGEKAINCTNIQYSLASEI
jgi:hypothetical protein